MPLTVGVLKETLQGETRVALTPEITAKLARLQARFYEIGISYDGRTYEEGKKIGLKDAFRAFTIDEFWSHSICVGVSAKLIATAAGVPVSEREEFFVAGLLHDLGKIPLNSCYPADYMAVVNSVKTAHEPLHLAEQKMFGINHCRVGGIIAEKWTLNKNLADALNYHHSPDEEAIENKEFLTIITLADMIAHMMSIPDWDQISLEGSTIERLSSRINIDLDTFQKLREPVMQELEKARAFLQITE